MKKQGKEIFLKAFGKNVARLRKERGLSQEQLAIDAEIDLSTLSRIERGILNVTINVIYQIAKALNISVKDIFDF